MIVGSNEHVLRVPELVFFLVFYSSVCAQYLFTTNVSHTRTNIYVSSNQNLQVLMWLSSPGSLACLRGLLEPEVERST